jgi:uncharacterized protein YwgA
MPSVELLTYLELVGQQLKLKLFEDRLALQKVTYLLQEAGVDLGYTFTWYVRGPYSPSLTRDAYQLVNFRVDTKQLPQPEAADAKKIQVISQLIKSVEGRRPSREYWLELLGSLHFVAKHLSPGKSRKEIIADFKQKKPGFKDDDIRQAWKLLQDHELIRRP